MTQNNQGQPMDKGKAVFGIFKTEKEVLTAQKAFKTLGFRKDRLSVLYPTKEGPRDFSQRQRTMVKTGAIAGVIVGGPAFVIFSLVVNTSEVSTLNSQGAFFNLNPVVFGILCMILGSFVGAGCGALIGAGTPEPITDRYGEYIDDGGILMSINVNDSEDAERAKHVLEKCGAGEISLIDEKQTWENILDKVSNGD